MNNNLVIGDTTLTGWWPVQKTWTLLTFVNWHFCSNKRASAQILWISNRIASTSEVCVVTRLSSTEYMYRLIQKSCAVRYGLTNWVTIYRYAVTTTQLSKWKKMKWIVIILCIEISKVVQPKANLPQNSIFEIHQYWVILYKTPMGPLPDNLLSDGMQLRFHLNLVECYPIQAEFFICLILYLRYG